MENNNVPGNYGDDNDKSSSVNISSKKAAIKSEKNESEIKEKQNNDNNSIKHSSAGEEEKDITV